MNNLIVLPMVLPLVIGVFLVFFQKNIPLNRVLTFILLLINLGIGIFLLLDIQKNGIQTLHFGGWLPPFGISFVADSFAVLLVLTATIVTAVCVLYAIRSIGEARGKAILFTLLCYFTGRCEWFLFDWRFI